MRYGLLAGAMLAFCVAGSAAQACTSTGIVWDGRNLTAALINPGTTTISNQSLSGGGCDIVIYNPPGARLTVDNADISDATYFGIYNNGGNITVTDSRLHEFGDVPFSSNQRGVAIYCESSRRARNNIQRNHFYNYQKSAVVMNGAGCGGWVVELNVLTGFGPTSLIPQNGFQNLGNSGGTFAGNTVVNHSYTGSLQASAGGILALGGPCFGAGLSSNNRYLNNTLINNDVGAYDLNLRATCQDAVATSTLNLFQGLTIWSGGVNNTSGNGSGGYQFGLSVAAYDDTFRKVSICGPGYNPANQPSGGAVGSMDLAGSSNLSVIGVKCYNVASSSASMQSASADEEGVGVAAPRMSRVRLSKKPQYFKK